MPKIYLTGLLLLLVFCLDTAGGAEAQDLPAGMWWHHPFVVKELALTKVEIATLDSIYRQNRRGLLEQKISVEKARLELDTLLEQKELDDETARAQFEKLEAARADLARGRFNFVIDIRKLLGYERFASLKYVQNVLQRATLNESRPTVNRP